MHVLLIALFAVAGPEESPLVADGASAAVPSQVLQVECDPRHATHEWAAGRGFRYPGGRITCTSGLILCPPCAVPSYYLPCSGGCGPQRHCSGYEPGYPAYFRQGYDYRRSFDYPWGGGPRGWIGPFCR